MSDIIGIVISICFGVLSALISQFLNRLEQ